MTFKKSQLAMAVAMAISLSAQAQINNSGSITIDGNASVTTANAATTTKDFVEAESSINEVFEKAPSSPSSIYLGDGESLLEIRNGQLNVLDMDLQDIDPSKEEFLSIGSESTFVIDNVTSQQTFIETNGAHIEHDGSASAIEISNSNLTGVDFDIVDGDEPIPDSLLGHKELITNNGGEIISSDENLTDPAATPGNAIDISKSTINGLIINEDWSGTEAPMTGGLIASTSGAGISVQDSQWHGGVINSSRNAVSEISGGTAGIELINTDFVGAIINEALGDPALNLPVISGEQSAIRVVGGSFKGDIDNSGLLLVGDASSGDRTAAEGAIALQDTRFEGNIVNSGEIRQEEDEFGFSSDKAAIVAQRTQVVGNIINNGQMQGAISVDGSKHEWTDTDENSNYTWANTAGHGSMQGNIVNTGQIESGYGRGAVDIYGADLTGSVINEGIIDSGSEGIRIAGGYVGQGEGTEDFTNDVYTHESSYGTRTGLIKGNIVNRQSASINSVGEGIELVSVNLTGNIENAGAINTQDGSGIAVLGGFAESNSGSNTTSYKLSEKGTKTTINGNIINQSTGIIAISGQEDVDGIHLKNVALNGNIENHGSITTAGSGIGIKGGEEFQVETTWLSSENSHQTIDTGLWQSQTSKLTGNIINTGSIVAGDGGVYMKNGAELHGNLINRGSIQGGDSGIALGGGYRESGTVTHTTLLGPNGEWLGYEKDLSQLEETKLSSAFNGSIINEGSIESQGTGIDLSGLTANASINNRGTINGADTGIYIADDVTGSLTINQLAGELNGATALRMNKVTRTNYTGGSINGNVENHGGTFYVEGNRSIAGDYIQTAGSTLAMDLNQETSLTANNINLADGSKVLIDLTKGNLYVQNGEQVELLKVNAGGTLTDTNVDYVVNSSLVTVASTERNEAGNLVLTFDRTSFTEQAQKHESDGKLNGQQVNNVKVLAAALQKLDALAQTNPAVAQLLNSLDGSPESFTALLPDVSGASVAGAMNASSQSGTQISVRARGLASGDAFANSGLWMQGLVSNGKQDNRYGDGYDADSRGFVLGADTELNSGLVLGAAYSFINSESDTANSSTNSDYHMATAYAAQALGQVLLDGQAYYAWGDNDSQRNIGASANYDSNLMGARVGAGYQFELGQATRFVPSLSLEASRLSVDGYTENGTGALTIGSQDFDRLELGLSAELSKDYQLTYAMVTPSLTLGAFHDFKAEAQGSTVAFAAAPAETFTVTGRDPEKNRYVAGVGLEIMNGENLTVSAEYNYNWNGDGFDANAGALKFRWDF